MSCKVPPLKLHLYNFEDNQYEDSKYVLTSPRSLESCSRLGVKPVDLLYKPLSEYQEELLPQDIPLRTIFNIYDEQEQARQTKLQLCRKERSRLIEEEREVNPRRRGVSLERPLSARPASRRQKCIKITRSYSDDDLSLEKLQRKRTAWATSIGHKRLTHNELDARAKELHNESERLRNVLLARKEGKPIARQSRRRVRSEVNVSNTLPVRSSSVSNISRSSFRERTPSRSQSTSRLNLSATDISIPHRDQKIIELMTSKRVEEGAMNKLRRTANLAWDKDRKLENETRNEAENRRRKLLLEENRVHKNKLKAKQQMRSGLDEELIELQKEQIRQKSLKWRSSFLRQHLSKEQKLADKQIYDQIRKRSQKKNLDLQDLDDEAYLESIGRKQRDYLSKSQSRRNNNMEHRNKNLMMNNRSERRLYQTKKNILDRTSVDDLDRSRLLNDLRHSRAKSNYSQMLDGQYRAINLLHQAREDRHVKAREAVSKMEEELESWRKHVVKDRRKSNKYAENVVNRVNELKSLRAHNNRLSKEIEHQQNLKRIEAEEEALRFGTKVEMAYKDRKTNVLQREKDYAVQQMRATAKVTQQLRDSIRKKYDTDTFDKKVLQAEIHANLGKRTPMKATKNRSSVEFC